MKKIAIKQYVTPCVVYLDNSKNLYTGHKAVFENVIKNVIDEKNTKKPKNAIKKIAVYIIESDDEIDEIIEKEKC